MADGPHTVHHVSSELLSVNIMNVPTSPPPLSSKESDTPILLDEAEQAKRLEERQKLFKEYRISRQAVLELRNEDRQCRNEAKVKQIELAEQWQVRGDTGALRWANTQFTPPG